METKPPILKVYQSFASTESTQIFGHVLRSISPQREKITRNPFKNALEMYRRYNVRPAKNIEIQLTLAGRQYNSTSDSRGFFRFELQNKIPKDTELKATVSLTHFPDVEQEVVLKVADPPEIIVSDIDDTILVSHATKAVRKLYLLLTKNHESRKAFDGIRSFYEELCGSKRNNLFFYVSSSEWNLYDFLRDFIAFNDLPLGVLLLQDLKSGLVDLVRSGGGSHDHKRQKIERLLHAYPGADFILVGDSGQKDPLIYREIGLKYPDRIKHIYIRDVRNSKRKSVNKIATDLSKADVRLDIFTQ